MLCLKYQTKTRFKSLSTVTTSVWLSLLNSGLRNRFQRVLLTSMVLLFLRQDRVTNNNGGACVYIKDDNIKCRVLEELSSCQDHEILWLHLRPTHLPRGVSCLIAVVVYHPPGADDNSIHDHLFHSLALAESKFPNYGIIVAGDFNRLNITAIGKHFRLKQIIKSPTRKDVILDLVLTNLKDYYVTPQSLPLFGLSDHYTTT